ncbi:unnamed protein product [Choristocarpus tenellus]
MRKVVVAATQVQCGQERDANIAAAEALVRRAAGDGANIILLQELFATKYFCQEQDEKYFLWAECENESPMLSSFQDLAKELGVVLPISFFERCNNAYFNSVVVFDSDGTNLGKYRKSHIPDGPGYQASGIFLPGLAYTFEKFYFSPGDTGFRVWNTSFGTIGVGICWDQWFPEAARTMALKGAELLFYPTAIGSEPQDKNLDSRAHWQRVMQGHSAANLVPVVASNRIGREVFDKSEITFYGRSFISDQTGAIVEQCGDTSTGSTYTRCEVDPICEMVLHEFDLDALRLQRASWGLFRDRRPDLYQSILSLDGGRP